MPQRRFTYPLLMVFLSAVAAGCQSSSGRVTGQPDPLVMTKSPVKGIASAEIPRAKTSQFPEPPRPPIHAWARAEEMRRTSTARLGAPTATVVNRKISLEARGNVGGIVSPYERISIASVTSDERPVFEHSADYASLRGMLEQTSSGKLLLRFARDTCSDAWGGRVCLEPNTRFSAYQTGDVLFVKGKIVKVNDVIQLDDWFSCPHYRVDQVLFLKHVHPEDVDRPARSGT